MAFGVSFTGVCALTVALLFVNAVRGMDDLDILVHSSPVKEKLTRLRKSDVPLSASTPLANEMEKTGSDVTSVVKQGVANGRSRRSPSETDILYPSKRIREFVGKRSSDRFFQSLTTGKEKRHSPAQYQDSDGLSFRALVSPLPTTNHEAYDSELIVVDGPAVSPVSMYDDMSELSMSKRIREFVGKRGDLIHRPREKRIREFVGKRRNEKRIREFVGKRGGPDELIDAVHGAVSDFYPKTSRPPSGHKLRAVTNKRIREFVGKRNGFSDAINLTKRIREFVGKRALGVSLGDYPPRYTDCGDWCGDYGDGQQSWQKPVPPEYRDASQTPLGMELASEEEATYPGSIQIPSLSGKRYLGPNTKDASHVHTHFSMQKGTRNSLQRVDRLRKIEKRNRQLLGNKSATAKEMNNAIRRLLRNDGRAVLNINKRIREFVGKRRSASDFEISKGSSEDTRN